MWIYGGYKITEDQAFSWCQSVAEELKVTPKRHGLSFIINPYLRAHKIPITVFPCDYEGALIYLVVTDKKLASFATPTDYPTIEETERARVVKEKVLAMGIGPVDFVVVPDP